MAIPRGDLPFHLWRTFSQSTRTITKRSVSMEGRQSWWAALLVIGAWGDKYSLPEPFPVHYTQLIRKMALGFILNYSPRSASVLTNQKCFSNQQSMRGPRAPLQGPGSQRAFRAIPCLLASLEGFSSCLGMGAYDNRGFFPLVLSVWVGLDARRATHAAHTARHTW